MLKKKMFFVYILQSLNEKHPNRTYVGYTVDIGRRIRQHNGEIKGGAAYTRVGRPYKLVCYVEGFETKSDAMSFEWFCHHPAGRPRRRGRGALRCRFDKYKGMDRRERILKYTMKKDKWKNYELNIVWMDVPK